MSALVFKKYELPQSVQTYVAQAESADKPDIPGCLVFKQNKLWQKIKSAGFALASLIFGGVFTWIGLKGDGTINWIPLLWGVVGLLGAAITLHELAKGLKTRYLLCAPEGAVMPLEGKDEYIFATPDRLSSVDLYVEERASYTLHILKLIDLDGKEQNFINSNDACFSGGFDDWAAALSSISGIEITKAEGRRYSHT